MPETQALLRLLADVATGLWRAHKKVAPDEDGELSAEWRSVFRHLQSCRDALTSAALEVRDHTGEKYAAGMALKVIAFQPTPGVQAERIAETIKPTIYYREVLIQQGEVVVATPQEAAAAPEVAEQTVPSIERPTGHENGTDTGANVSSADPRVVREGRTASPSVDPQVQHEEEGNRHEPDHH